MTADKCDLETLELGRAMAFTVSEPTQVFESCVCESRQADKEHGHQECKRDSKYRQNE